MRSHHYRCRTGAIAPVLTVAEYALIRPAVPVIPGRLDMPHRPPYVPVNAHYVNPPGGGRARYLAFVVGSIVVGTAMLVTAYVLFLSFVADPSHTRPASPMPTVTPSTYGPPPR